MFHGKTMFICNSHEKSSYLSSSVYRGRLLWIENIVRIKFVLILKNKAFNECRFVHKLILISFRWQKKKGVKVFMSGQIVTENIICGYIVRYSSTHTFLGLLRIPPHV